MVPMLAKRKFEDMQLFRKPQLLDQRQGGARVATIAAARRRLISMYRGSFAPYCSSAKLVCSISFATRLARSSLP